MATSPAQLAANAANAQLSTGPRTAEGKARSSQNARTHGLTSRDLVIQPDEREEFDEMLHGFQADIQPYGEIQQTVFDELVAAAWNLRRIRRMEVALSAGHSYKDLVENDALEAKLDRLARHKTRLDRVFHRNLKELKALQTNTVIAATLPSEICDALPVLASAIEISKRTHQFPTPSDRQHLAERVTELIWTSDSQETTSAAGSAT